MPTTTETGQGASLPIPPTALVGREREVADIAGLLGRDGVRLVTLTGPGGVGKTRLAQQVAWEARDHFADGVAFASLAAISDHALVLSAVARALGVLETAERPLAECLAAFLRDRRLLLLLDNFEQLLPAAPAVAALLAACRGLQLLATSRAPLRIHAEQEYPLGPLALPASPSAHVPPTQPEDVAESAAVALFVQRARAVDPGFALTEANTATVVAICAAVDGLPLAIELAAARVKVLSPQAILARLGRRLTLLTGGPRDAPERLRTMRAAIAWSHDLLTPEEQILFRRLAVFAGGFSLEAVETVVSPDGAAERAALDRLAALVDHSLVRRTADAAEKPRYGMLETIREYALERLEANGEVDILKERHAAYFLALTEQAEPRYYTAAEPAWFARLETEQPNLRAALGWAEERGGAAPLHRLAAALWWFWRTGGHLHEGQDRMERALACSGSETVDPATRAAVLLGLADIALVKDDADRAETLLDEGFALAQAAGNAKLVAEAVFFRSWAAERRGDFGRAEELRTEALGRWRDLGEWAWTTGSLVGLGGLAVRRGDLRTAAARYEEALDLGQRVGFGSGVVWALGGLGAVALDRGDPRQAAAHFGRALALARAKDDRIIVAHNLDNLGRTAWAAGYLAQAALLLAAGEREAETLGAVAWPMHRAEREAPRAALRDALGEEAFAAAWSVGRALPVEQAAAAAEAVVARLASPPPTSPSSTPAHGLSLRELEVLRLLVEGASNPRIGARLSISDRTVDSHVSSILAKLGLPSRAAAAAHAVRHGLV